MRTVIKEVKVGNDIQYRLFAIKDNTESFIATFLTKEQALKAAQIYALKKD